MEIVFCCTTCKKLSEWRMAKKPSNFAIDNDCEDIKSFSELSFVEKDENHFLINERIFSDINTVFVSCEKFASHLQKDANSVNVCMELRIVAREEVIKQRYDRV